MNLLKPFTAAVALARLAGAADRIGRELARANDLAEKQLELSLLQANTTLAQFEEGRAKLRETEPPAATEVQAQTPEELANLQEAFEHAEGRFGKGKVPESLDLYAELRAMAPDNPDEELS